MAEVIFQREGFKEVRVEANGDRNLLQLAREANIAIDAPCSGNGACGKCRIRLLDGELESRQTGAVSDGDYAEGWRLACESRPAGSGEIRVLVPDTASAYVSRIRTADFSDERGGRAFSGMREIFLGDSHGFRLIACEVEKPAPDDTRPDAERLTAAVLSETGAKHVTVTLQGLVSMAAALREENFRVRVLVHDCGEEMEVWDVYPASQEARICGIAIDIGTTTVSGVLSELLTGKILAGASAGNGQIRYGADVINRIIEQGRSGGRKRLRDAVIKETLLPLIHSLEETAGIEEEQVVLVTVAANTTMNHLLLGAWADPIRTDPYIPGFFRCDPLPAYPLFPAVHTSARLLLAPNIGSYVGGDITAGAMAAMMWDREEYSLFIDLGTNGEIVFGNRDFLIACACSAGPAFEGGDISCGMRATDGAVEAVVLDHASMEPELRVIGGAGQKPVGICGSGIIDLIAELYRCEIIDSRGRFIREGKRILRDEYGTGRYVLSFREESATGREISVTEVDIDSFIRAKGAIFSAVCTMLSALDLTPDVIEQVFVAGGIGSGINMENAVRIGMFPDLDRERFHYVGNTSLAGAYAMLLSDSACEKVHKIASGMTYMELSTEPGYMDQFVAACFIPHTDRSLFPSL